MKKNLVITVGNDMMGDDGAGPLLAHMIKQAPLEDWEVLEGGNVPENYVFKIREMEPERVIIVDAADMDLETGEIALIDKDGIASSFLITTHTLPLTYLMEAIREFVPRVELLGIQPEIVAFGYPVSPLVKKAVECVYAWLGQTGKRPGAPRESLGAIVNPESGREGGADESDCSAQGQFRSHERGA
jgi:hydrogenase 3 maturation protease